MNFLAGPHYIYGENVDIFGKSDKMMKNKWNS